MTMMDINNMIIAREGHMEVMQAIKERRSIRRYTDAPVSDKDLETVLEAARWAPSWANNQCWRFIIVRDPEIKERIANTLPPDNRALTAIRTAPILIVVCAKIGRSGYIRGEQVREQGDYWFMFDVGLAMQNLTLAAHSLGLGTVHVGWFDAKRVREILGVPEGTAVVEITPLGYPDERPIAPRRRELSEIVFHERYGEGRREIP